MKCIKEQIAVMQAFADGNTIQVGVESSTGWTWVPEKNPKWNWELFDYRVLPEYGPYPDEKTFMDALKKHGSEVRRNIFGDECLNIGLTCVHGEYKCLLSSEHYRNSISFDDLFGRYRWADDNTVCGIKAESDASSDCRNAKLCNSNTDTDDSGGQFYEAVDLGLPSGTKWADRNVGATSPEEAGKYFAWGDTEGYYTKDIKKGMFTCEWYNNRPCHLIESDITPGSRHDAAHVNMGAGWQMPSKEDMIELRDHTRQEFATINGVDGTKFINKTDNSKYIFIPFTYCSYGGDFIGDACKSSLWSTELYSHDKDSAQYLFCDNHEFRYVYSNHRYCGFSVRGVIKS